MFIGHCGSQKHRAVSNGQSAGRYSDRGATDYVSLLLNYISREAVNIIMPHSSSAAVIFKCI